MKFEVKLSDLKQFKGANLFDGADFKDISISEVDMDILSDSIVGLISCSSDYKVKGEENDEN